MCPSELPTLREQDLEVVWAEVWKTWPASVPFHLPVYAHVCTCMKARQHPWMPFFKSSTWDLRQASSLNLSSSSSQAQGSPCLSSQCCGCKPAPPDLIFLYECWGSNQGPHNKQFSDWTLSLAQRAHFKSGNVPWISELPKQPRRKSSIQYSNRQPMFLPVIIYLMGVHLRGLQYRPCKNCLEIRYLHRRSY